MWKRALFGCAVLVLVSSGLLIWAQDVPSGERTTPSDAFVGHPIAPPSSALTPTSQVKAQPAPRVAEGTAGPCILNPSFELTPDLVNWTVVWGSDPNVSYYYSQNAWVDRSNSTSYRTDGAAGAVLFFEGDVYSYCATGWGPSLHSSPFAGNTAEQISVDWYVAEDWDGAVGRGFVRDAGTDAVVATLFDTTGSPTYQGIGPNFLTATATLPYAGVFYVDLQVGSYDSSCGGAIGAYLVADNLRATDCASIYNLTFMDDYGRSQLCVDSTTGAWQWSVLKGNGTGKVYTGAGTVMNGSGYMRLAAAAGSGYGLSLIYYTTAHRATASFSYRPDAVSSALYDANTTDDGPCL